MTDRIENKIHDRLIRFPLPWTTFEIGGKEGISRRLTSIEMDNMWELVERTRHLLAEDVARTDFTSPLVERLMDDVRHELVQGRGAVLLSGLDISKRSLEDFG